MIALGTSALVNLCNVPGSSIFAVCTGSPSLQKKMATAPAGKPHHRTLAVRPEASALWVVEMIKRHA